MPIVSQGHTIAQLIVFEALVGGRGAEFMVVARRHAVKRIVGVAIGGLDAVGACVCS